MSVIISDTANIFTLGKKDASPAQNISVDYVYNCTARVWGYHSTSGDTGSASYNVSSNTDLGPGNFTFATVVTLAQNPSPIVHSVRSGLGTDKLSVTNMTTNEGEVNIWDVSAAGTVDDDGFFIVMGNFA